MTLKFTGYVELPANIKSGGFDHAAIHRATSRVQVAHTCNDALDVIDGATDRYLHSISNLTGVAGALVSDERNLVFISNRGENTVDIFSPNDETKNVKVSVGVRPNGLVYDFTRNLLLAANVGDPAIPNSFTLSIVDVNQRAMISSIPVPGRTRWTVLDADTDVFYVNISDPAQIVVVDAQNPTHIMRTFAVPVARPYGLDLDAVQHRLFCAYNGKQLVGVNTRSGKVLHQIVSAAEVDARGTRDAVGYARSIASEIARPGLARHCPDRVCGTRELNRAARVGNVGAAELVHAANVSVVESWLCLVARVLSFCQTA